jgi:hypothetical protein
MTYRCFDIMLCSVLFFNLKKYLCISVAEPVLVERQHFDGATAKVFWLAPAPVCFSYCYMLWKFLFTVIILNPILALLNNCNPKVKVKWVQSSVILGKNAFQSFFENFMKLKIFFLIYRTEKMVGVGAGAEIIYKLEPEPHKNGPSSARLVCMNTCEYCHP